MPVVISCTCGKRFRAKDEHVGKSAKCPFCGQILIIKGKSDDQTENHIREELLREASQSTQKSSPKGEEQSKATGKLIGIILAGLGLCILGVGLIILGLLFFSIPMIGGCIALALGCFKFGGECIKEAFMMRATQQKQALSSTVPLEEGAKVVTHSKNIHNHTPLISGSDSIETMKRKAHRLAVWSLVLGILSFAFSLFAAIPTVICGHKALSRIKETGINRSRKIAIAGIITGYIVILITALAFILPSTGEHSKTKTHRKTKQRISQKVLDPSKVDVLPTDGVYSESSGSGGNYRDPMNDYFEVQQPAEFSGVRVRRDKSKVTIMAGSDHVGEVVPASFITFYKSPKNAITVIARKTFTRIEDDFEQVLEDFLNKLPGAKIHRSRFIIIDGVKGAEIYATFRGHKILSIKYKKYGLDHTISIACSIGDFQEYQYTFVNFLRSYRGLPPK